MPPDDYGDPFSVGPGALIATADDIYGPRPAPDDAPPAAPVNPLQARQERILDAQERYIERASQSMDRQTDIAEEKSRALAPYRQRQLEMAQRPLPEPPTPRQPPPAPQRRDHRDDEEWLMAAALLGALAGGLSRNHATNALSAFGAAMEGYNEGSREKFDQSMKIWEAENKRTIEINTATQSHYKDILENRRLSSDQMAVELQMAAQQYDDRAMAEAARSKNSLVIAQLYDQQAKALAQMQRGSRALSADLAAGKQRELLKQADDYANSPQGLAQAKAIAELREKPLPAGRTATEAAINRAVMAKVRQFNPEYSESHFGAEPDEARAQAIAHGQLPPIANPRQPRDRATMNRALEINPELSAPRYAGDVAGQRSLGTRLANMENIAYKLASVVPDALAASDAVARGRWVPVNQAIQMVQRGSSNPALAAFATQNINLAELWARSQKPTGVLDVALQQRALDILTTATSKEAYRTVVGQIVREIQREIQATKDQREHKPLEVPEVPGAFVPPGQRTIGAPAAADPLGIR